MHRIVTYLVLTTAIAAVLAMPASGATRALTPDQQLANGFAAAGDAARTALGILAQSTRSRAAGARVELARMMEGLAAARRAAPRAIGALETPSVRAALQQGRKLGRKAAADIASRRYAAAQLKIQQALDLESDALQDFGVPLEKEFGSFAVNRNFGNVLGFADYSGLSATVGEDISEVVIGPADRGTANAGERGAAATSSAGLPITLISLAVISDPIGNFTSGWCELESGLITCRMRPAMPRDRIFTIAFGPKLEPGTKLLVKFRVADGRRSYAVVSIR